MRGEEIMIVDLNTAKEILDIPITQSTDDTLLNIYVQGMDALFNLLCDREFDSAAYTYELYNGNGRQHLQVKNPPITIAPIVSIGRLSAIQIKNTSADATYAAAEVDMVNAKIRLLVLGGANADDTDVDFSSYTTLSAVVTQINAVGKGWDAVIYDSDLDDIKSTALLRTLVTCGSQRNTTASYEYLEIPDDPVNIDNWNPDTGRIDRSGGFPAGYGNIAISYTGGYTATTMPHDLKLAVLAGIKALYDKGEESGFGVNGFTEQGLTVRYAEWLPDITLKAIEDYTRTVSL
jgi:hypothetical protein